MQHAVAMILGAFPMRDEMVDFRVPGAQVERFFLPGFHTPRTPELSITAFAAALDNQIAERFPGREVTVIGISVGALVALALRRAEVRQLVLVEPFLGLTDDSPLTVWLQHTLRRYPHNQLLHEWVERVFGVTEAETHPLDYSGLVQQNRRPLWVVAGDSRAPVIGLPSLTGVTDRRLLADHGARFVNYMGGHGPPHSAILAAIGNALQEFSSANAMKSTAPAPPEPANPEPFPAPPPPP